MRDPLWLVSSYASGTNEIEAKLLPRESAKVRWFNIFKNIIYNEYALDYYFSSDGKSTGRCKVFEMHRNKVWAWLMIELVAVC